MPQFAAHQNNRINLAIQFASIAHGNQVRKGNEHVPYIFHPIDVANEVITYSGLPIEEMEKASVDAILHDTVEDTAVTFENLHDQFGADTADDVRYLTKDETVPKEQQLEESLTRLESAPDRVKCVKLADRISNLKTFPAMWGRNKISQYLNDSEQIAERLGSASLTLKARLLMSVAENRVRLSLFTAK